MRSSSTSLVAPSSRTSLAASTVGLLVEQVELFLETDLHQGLPRLVGGDALPRGEPHGDRLHAERADAGEDAFAAPRHGEVGDVAEVAVQGRDRRHVAHLGGQIAGATERPDHSERRQVDSRGLQAGAAHGLKQREHHVAARGDCEDVHHPVALWSVAHPDHAVIEDGLIQRHRDGVLGAKADRRIELLRVLDQRQLERPDDDPLVGDPEPDPLAELVAAEEVPERGGERCQRPGCPPRGSPPGRAARSRSAPRHGRSATAPRWPRCCPTRCRGRLRMCSS